MDFMFIILKAFEWVLKNTNVGFWVIAGFVCIVIASGVLKALVATNKIRLYNKEDFMRLNDEEDNSPEHDYLLDNVYHTED